VCDEEVIQYMAARGPAPHKKYTASRKGAFQNNLENSENSKRPSEENPPTRCCTRSEVAPPLRDHTTRAVLRLLSEEEEQELLIEAFQEGRLAEATLMSFFKRACVACPQIGTHAQCGGTDSYS
jgi:hypothetical protein